MLSMIALLALPILAQDGGDPGEAMARAEGLACRGRVRDAQRLYRRLAEDLAGTEEGALAALRATPSALLGFCPLVENGPSANRIDVVILGDGYTIDHQYAFAELAEDVPRMLERVEPFREYWSVFNFWRGVCVSAEAGIDGFGRYHDTLLDGFTRNTDSGHVGVSHSTVMALLEQMPGSDGLAFAFVKQGVAGTAMNGIATIGGRSARTTVHEWGHAFARLGDEYSTHTHNRSATRARINLSISEELEQVPWRHWLEAKHPGVGLYEGGNGKVRDVWRPTASGCLMNNAEVFCPVCREAIVLRIYASIDPIEEVEPPAPPPGIREPVILWGDPIELRVRALRPASHRLEVRWWVQSAKRFPLTPGARFVRPRRVRSAAPSDRSARGPLLELDEPPTKKGKVASDGNAILRLRREDLEPGLYRVTCRVRDPARPRGERWPWVLSDPNGLLESERVWWVEVR